MARGGDSRKKKERLGRRRRRCRGVPGYQGHRPEGEGLGPPIMAR